MTNLLDYHNVPGLNASGINAFYKSPLHFWKQSSFNDRRVKQEKTPSLILGSLAHSMILEPENVDRDFALAPNVDRRTKEGKEDYLYFEENIKGRTVIECDQYRKATEMRNAMFANPAVRRLLGNGCSEKPVYWHRTPDGIRCKAKLDYLRSGLLVDYKTTADAGIDGFSRSMATYGYYRQMAWYMEAAEKAHGERPKGAVIIAQDKELPEAIGIYVLNEDALILGARECDMAYQEISRRLESNEWGAYPEEIQEIGLPAWYFNKFNNQEGIYA